MVMVAYPFAKSSVAFATGVPSAVLSWVLRRSVPGARLGLVSGEVVGVASVADWLPFAHPLSPIAGVMSKALAMIAGLSIGAAYPHSRRSKQPPARLSAI